MCSHQGAKLNSEAPYHRSLEEVEILKQAWPQDEINFKGAFFNIKSDLETVKPYQKKSGPLLYFESYSPFYINSLSASIT